MSQGYDFVPLLFHVNMKMPFPLAFYMLPRNKKRCRGLVQYRVSVFTCTFLAEFAAKLWVGLMLWNRKMAAAAATMRVAKIPAVDMQSLFQCNTKSDISYD